MDRLQEATLIAPPGVVETALSEIIRLYGYAEPVEEFMDRFLQALLAAPSATDSAIDEILFWCRRDGAAEA